MNKLLQVSIWAHGLVEVNNLGLTLKKFQNIERLKIQNGLKNLEGMLTFST